MNSNGDKCEEEIIHSYYQWVPYMLILQGCLFLIPKIVWGQLEEGKMTSISKEILAGTIASEDYDKKVKTVARNVSDYINMPSAGHLRYGLGYFFCQVCKWP